MRSSFLSQNSSRDRWSWLHNVRILHSTELIHIGVKLVIYMLCVSLKPKNWLLETTKLTTYKLALPRKNTNKKIVLLKTRHERERVSANFIEIKRILR